ncbi:MAG: isochorismate synthase [Thermoplasmatota archaeon]
MTIERRTRTVQADPFALLQEPDTGLWDDGDLSIFQGVALEIVAEGPTRFRDVRAIAEALGAPDAVFFGGFSFQDGPPTEPWTLPSARFILPERIITWRDGVANETRFEVHGERVAAPTTVQPGPKNPSSSRSHWRDAVKEALQAIEDGDATKVVLSRCKQISRQDPVGMVEKLRAAEPGTTRFLFRHGEHAFYGATPETLVKLDGRVWTHALAGTSPTGDDSLLQSPKDLLEHELVVTYLRGRLESAGATGLEQGRRRLKTLRHVQHLETPIEADARGKHVLELAEALHPTPAVGGLPPRRSAELIRSLEGYPRGWYAGAVGWFDGRGRGQFNVALRCALATPDTTWLFAGAGIVAGSEPDAEWEETERKLATFEELHEQ